MHAHLETHVYVYPLNGGTTLSKLWNDKSVLLKKH